MKGYLTIFIILSLIFIIQSTNLKTTEKGHIIARMKKQGDARVLVQLPDKIKEKCTCEKGKKCKCVAKKS